MIKQDIHQFVGMQQDIKSPEVNSKYIYEGKNIKITSQGDNSLLHVTNIKGNKKIGDLLGVYLGHCIIGNYLVLFTTEVATESKTVETPDPGGSLTPKGVGVVSSGLNVHKEIDHIYRITISEDTESIELVELFVGNLGFSLDYPIETLGIYENENIQKVYWVDGLNQPRVINIVKGQLVNNKYTNSSFDFIPSLKLDETITVTKNSVSNGTFHSGTIQYAFSYYNKYGQESNIFHVTDLQYIAPKDRGADPDEIINNSFTITINNVDTSFEYLRIYSIHRTSIDSVPTVKIIQDIRVSDIIYYIKNISHLNTPYLILYNQNSIILTAKNMRYRMPELDEGRNAVYTDLIAKSSITRLYDYLENIYAPIGNIKGNTIKPFYHFNRADLPGLVIKVDGNYMTWGSATDIYISKDYDESGDHTIFVGYETEEDVAAESMILFTGYNETYNGYNIVDTGNTGEIIDNSILLYVGGEEIISNTITSKDNTLFLGNITIQRPSIDASIKNSLLLSKTNELITEHESLSTTNRIIPVNKEEENKSNFYSYASTLSKGYSAGFKSGEYYRLGLQFQYKDGKWSDPVYLGDYQTPDNIRPTYNNFNLNTPQIEYTLDSTIEKNIFQLGYKKVRPVVVFPSINERRVLIQGMVCPTVFKLKNRISNAPYVQSSWFIRPYVKYELKGNEEAFKDTYPERGAWAEFRHFYGLPSSGNSRQEIQGPGLTGFKDTEVPFEKFDSITSYEDYAVDQSIITLHSPDIEWGIGSYNNFNDYSFRIVGFINFTSNIGDIDIQTSSPTVSTYAQGFIKRGTYYSDLIHKELYKGKYVNASRSLISGSFYQDGYIKSLEDGVPSTRSIEKFLVYTWHRSGSLNNDTVRASSEGTQSAKLLKKVISNLKFSQNNTWLNPTSSNTVNNYWTPEEGITIPQLFNSNELSLLSLDSPKREEIQKMSYYGIVDDLVIHNKPYSILYKESSNPDIYKEGNSSISDSFRYGNESVRIKYKSTPHIVLGFNYSNNYQNILPTIKHGEQLGINKVTSEKYPSWMNPSIVDGSIVNSDTITQHVIELVHTKETNNTTNKLEPIIPEYTTGKEYIIYESEDKTTLELWYIDIEGYEANENPILSIHYIDSPDHLDDSIRDYYRNVIFSAYDETLKKSRYFKFKDLGEEQYKFVELTKLSREVSTASHIINHEVISLDENTYNNISDSFLYLAELYRKDIPKNLFGGNTQDNIENNIWIPAGKAVSISDNKDSNTIVTFTNGDTWYQRYDCLKTYPFTQEDENQVVEIASFMCETRVNADGRYDKNRGQLSNLNMTPRNFNLWNPVYSQKDNFFKYRILDSDFYKLNKFPNTITWTKEKHNGEDIDTWTNITMASTLDLDGDKGEITSLNTFNNEIYCFQKLGISNIIFNAREQISTTSGVPIEISNGMKVNGKRYISNSIGCNNKWSIVESIYGIYFVDNITKGIYLLSDNIKSLSHTLNMKDYITKFNNIEPWKVNNFEPIAFKFNNDNSFNNFKVSYDKVDKKVYFVNGQDCLVYSEELGQFESFVDYQNTFSIFNIQGSTYSLYYIPTGNSGDWYTGLWKNNVLDDTNIYGDNKEVSLTVVSNQNPLNDKIFNTVEFRGNSYNENGFDPKVCPFNKIRVWNEYQDTEDVKLVFNSNTPSNLKQKFRIWRANIPRDKSNGRDRIRNTWAKIKLTGDSKKIELNDLNIHYFM